MIYRDKIRLKKWAKFAILSWVRRKIIHFKMSLAMKTLFRSCLVLVALCAVMVSKAATMLTAEAAHTNTINAILGDVSFVKKFGALPTSASAEALRIQTHLEYVETLLRAKDVSHLPKQLRERRAALLNKLHEYRLAGSFPTNLAFPNERRPCFIDAAGNICAVGYLIEQTAGRALAERINAAHQYDFLADMQMPELSEWVAASGLTARECAMIQPSYEPKQDRDFKFEYINPFIFRTTDLSFTLQVRVVGLPTSSASRRTPPFYSKMSLYLFGAFTDGFFPLAPAWSIEPTFSQWETSATLPGRWNATFIFTVPEKSMPPKGIHWLRLQCNTISNSVYWTETYATQASITINNPTSVRDLTLPSTLPISPNPITDALTLALPENELHSVRLTNTLGSTVWTLSDASGATTLDVSGLSAGVYFVEVQSARRRSVQKVVKY